MFSVATESLLYGSTIMHEGAARIEAGRQYADSAAHELMEMEGFGECVRAIMRINTSAAEDASRYRAIATALQRISEAYEEAERQVVNLRVNGMRRVRAGNVSVQPLAAPEGNALAQLEEIANAVL